MSEEIMNKKPKEEIVEDLVKDLDQTIKKKKSKKKKIIIISSIIIVVIIILFSVFKNKDNNEYTFASVEKTKLIQTVSETGMIKSVDEIELNFQNSGNVNEVLVSIGDRVSSTQILAKLDYSDLNIESRQKYAQLEIAQANLDKLLIGATDYEISIYEANLNQTKTNYESAIKELETTTNNVEEQISQAEENLSTGIANKKMSSIIIMKSNISKAETALDKINTILNDDEAENLLSVRNRTYLFQTQSNYSLSISSVIDSEAMIEIAENSLNEEDINNALNSSIATLNKTFTTLNNCYDVLENTISSSSFTTTEIDSYKTDISTQLTTIGTSISSVESAKQNLNDTILSLNNALSTAIISGEQQRASAETRVNSYYESWQISKAEKERLEAPPTYQDIILARAEVKQAQASVDSTRNKIEKSIIKAPIDGQITKIEYDVGEQVSSNKVMIYLLTDNNLEVEIDISETDINKINKGDLVKITLDAFGDEMKIPATVYEIEPAETVIQDVIYYKTTIHINSPDDLISQIKPGMTANAIITTSEKENVLVIPSRAIIEKNGDGKFVRIMEEKKVKEIPVKTGLYGDDGLVEIISGLEEGQEIITYIKTSK
jgi:RND family efflux transporter MFP subunit